MQVEFFGAAGEVTGSCHLVTVGERRVLLDCGMVQGSDDAERRNEEPFSFDPRRLDAVVLSHAHIDHIGRLPLLVKYGFRGPIYAQVATAELTEVMLEDAAGIAESDIVRDNLLRLRRGEKALAPIYTRNDVRDVVRQIRRIDYDVETTIAPGVRVRLRDAGHILGSAAIELMSDRDGPTRKLVYSGDIGPKGTPILRDPAPIDDADLVLMESTYGNRVHRSRGDTVAELAEIFRVARDTGGNVVIPAFAVGRTQELLYWFARHYLEWHLGAFRIFLDSPLAAKVVEIYARHTELFDEEAAKLAATHRNPLRLPNLQVTGSVGESQAINAHQGGAIIIAGSGMCNGGRIRHHLRHNIGRHNAHIVFVGYQAEGTLGRLLVDGAPQVKLFGDWLPVRAARHTVGGLSAHADQMGLVEWYAQFRSRPQVYLVHGEDIAREPLATILRDKFRARAHLSRPGMVVQV